MKQKFYESGKPRDVMRTYLTPLRSASSFLGAFCSLGVATSCLMPATSVRSSFWGDRSREGIATARDREIEMAREQESTRAV